MLIINLKKQKKVRMKKKMFTEEEKKILRAEWRRRNPELAARRDAKRKAAEAAAKAEEEQEFAEENLFLSELPKDEAELEAYRKKIKALWESVIARREQYVIERDIEKTKLSDEEKADFVRYVRCNYNSANQAVAAIINLLLIEGLRYPDKELNNFCYNFLREKESHGEVSWSLWVNLWDTEFVPLDAVRLMLDIRDGRFYPLDRFKELIKIVSPKIQRHLEQEYRRLEWARGLEESPLRSRECGRKARRIFYFEALLGAYGIPTDHTC